MPSRFYSTLTDHIAEQIRLGMAEGRWREILPGRDRLAEELGCSHSTVTEALRRLQKKGLLGSQGPGRRRKIQISGGAIRSRSLRIAIFLYEPSDRKTDYLIELVHQLRGAGHDAVLAAKTIRELGMNVNRIARFVSAAEAEAWVVIAGSREILEWFAGQSTPAFAMFGRNRESPLASVSLDKAVVLAELAGRLVELGHRRIVLLSREERRKPIPAFVEQAFLDRLKALGIPSGTYNLPEWKDSPKEFHLLLDSLFRHTPPTALIIDEPSLCVAVLQHLSRLGLSAPEDVSLACLDMSDFFEWCDPGIAHIAWNSRSVVKHVVKWAENISRGKDDRSKNSSKVKLIPGGTIGPAPGKG